MSHRRESGFTLIELLIVIAIIGILAAIAIPNLLNAVQRGKQKRTMSDMRALATAVEAYAVDNNVYPAAIVQRGSLHYGGEALATNSFTNLTPTYIEGFQAKRHLEAGNRTVNMDVGALRQVMKRFKQWRRFEDDVKMLTEAGGGAGRPYALGGGARASVQEPRRAMPSGSMSTAPPSSRRTPPCAASK